MLWFCIRLGVHCMLVPYYALVCYASCVCSSRLRWNYRISFGYQMSPHPMNVIEQSGVCDSNEVTVTCSSSPHSNAITDVVAFSNCNIEINRTRHKATTLNTRTNVFTMFQHFMISNMDWIKSLKLVQ